MFKINAEELKREIQEKMARLKKIDEKLQKVAPANTRREKEIKKWMKRWEVNTGYKLKLKQKENNDWIDFDYDGNYIETDFNREHDLGCL